MVLDTSALASIIFQEPTRAKLLAILAPQQVRVIAAATLLEAGILLRARRGDKGVQELYDLLRQMGIEVLPFDEAQSRLAIEAFGKFGKGMGHKAQLNFGDCAVYALAKTRNEPVLAIGADFQQTDLRVLP
ncbi:MAG: type II toxin-antitoxin system VapC family toxin [Acidobacteria bacterium]|nr:type II toxin-antitoxin system VapC family toxin [Acidobacteriota bacterium]